MQYKWTVLTVTTVGVMMSGIDTRILIIGLPQIAEALHADAEQAIWFTQGYALASTVTLLLIGRVTDIFGRVRLYNAGFAIFAAGSLLAGLSLDPTLLVAFRVIQGFGSALLWTNSIAMITDATPRDELGFFLGINSISFNIGSVVGLTLSGVILFFLDWRYLFFINVPIGIFGTLWAYLRLHEISTRERGSPIDWPGFAAFVTSLTALLLALTYAVYEFATVPELTALVAASAASMVVFVYLERRTPHPLLDLKILRIRPFFGSSFASLVTVIAFSSVVLLISLYLQLVVGLTPLQAGLAIIPYDLGMFVTAPLSGRLSDRLGKLPFMVGGTLMLSVSMLELSTLSSTTPYPYLAANLVLQGAALSVFLSPNTSWGMMAVPAERRGIAASLRSTFWNVGVTLSLNLTIFVMTFTVPFGILSAVIASGSASAVPVGDAGVFLSAIRGALVFLAFLELFTLLPTLWGITGPGHAPEAEELPQ